MELVSSAPNTIWVPVDANGGSYDTLYVGQLIRSLSDGVAPLGQASGAYDTSNKRIPWGIVIGTNLYEPSYSSTSYSNSITSVNSHTDTVQRRLGEGYAIRRGDKGAKVHIALIYPNTIIRAKIYNSTIGTALTLLTVSTGSTDGAGFTSNAAQHTPVADLAMIQGLSGANTGIQRVTTDTSTTVRTVEEYLPYDVAVGDTFAGAPIRPFGMSRVQFDSESLFIDGSQALTSNYFGVHILKADLTDRANAWCEFTFMLDHFCANRA